VTNPETNPETLAAAKEAADDARDDRAHRWIVILAVTGIVGVLALAGLFFVQHQQIDGLKVQSQDNAQAADRNATAARSLSADAQKLADQVVRLGATPVVQPPAAVPTAVGPTETQIAAAVDAWLRAHPPAAGQSATPAMVATAVAEFLVAHPPQPGRPPTPAEISDAANTYIATHAAQFQGQPGTNGKNGADGANGKDATDAQVAATVAAYCAAHGQCAGPPGTNGTNGADGAQGVSVTDVTFARDSSGSCQVVVTLFNPATGKTSQATHPAGEAACPLITGR
jgi:hypothetical protein